MTRSVPVGELRHLGDRALLIGVTDAAAGRILASALRRRLVDTGGPDATVEVVVGFATVLVSLLDDAARLPTLQAAATAALMDVTATDPDDVVEGRLITIPCAFDGPDLAEVAARTGLRHGDVVSHFTAAPLSVAVMGFSPGFAYLDGLPEPLRAVPRRDEPRPMVEPGSVALANGHAAVYPTASPGGWNLIGRTGFPLLDPALAPYAVLAPGDRVQFTVAEPLDVTAPPPAPDAKWTPPSDARAAFEVVAPGFRSVLQDGGRLGVAAVGVPGAGPADPVSLTLANRLVGNPDDAAALEVTAGGLRLRALAESHVAVVGAAPALRLDGDVVAAGRVTPLVPGRELEVGPVRSGCRTYLAVAGGLLGPSLFGSVATDELTGLGPGVLTTGQHLHAGAWSPPLGDHLVHDDPAALDGPGDVTLRVLPGPHGELFAADALARLAECEFVVGASSNRVGIRLEPIGDAPVPVPASAAGGVLDSHGVVTGVVQVPPGGQPVVLLPDHATLGGYPVVAVVTSADHGRLGQCGPGTRVRLVPVDTADAEAARLEQRRSMNRAVVGHYPLTAG